MTQSTLLLGKGILQVGLHALKVSVSVWQPGFRLFEREHSMRIPWLLLCAVPAHSVWCDSDKKGRCVINAARSATWMLASPIQ